MDLLSREYRTIESIKGPLVFVRGARKVCSGDLVTLEISPGNVRRGQVIELNGDLSVIQVFGTTENLSPLATTVRFHEEGIKADLSPLMVGRVFSGAGLSLDGGVEIAPRERRSIQGEPINPVCRDTPCDFIQTGISSIDGLNTLVRGQKLPLFSGAGLPANEIAVQIISNASIPGEEEDFAIVFGAMGVTAREADYFQQAFSSSGAIEHSVLFINLADDPVIERLLTPRYALTAAEYLAFDLNRQVLVVLTDMTHYCNALREISSSREEVPGRRGYPGYMYTDLSTIYERAGRIKGRKGSVTQLPILSMPDDDITHPIADLTGYITEGQIVLDRGLHRRGIFPPINVLPSLSRLMSLGIGEGRTREDHRQWSDQLYMAYARGEEQRRIASIIGEDGLSESDRRYLLFAKEFEESFIHQGRENRPLEESLRIGWRLLNTLPSSELIRIDRHLISRYGTTEEE